MKKGNRSERRLVTRTKRSKTPTTIEGNDSFNATYLKSPSPITHRRKSTSEFDLQKILAIIPYSLGKIQKPATYRKELAKIYELENQDSQTSSKTFEQYINTKVLDAQRQLNQLLENKESPSQKQNSFYPIQYFRKTINRFSPGIVRIYPKESSITPTSTSTRLIQNDRFCKTPTPPSQPKQHLNTSSPSLKRIQPQKYNLEASFSVKNHNRLKKSPNPDKITNNTHFLAVEKYNGDYVNGKRHGNGEIIYSNGDKYKGKWINDKKEGYGKYLYKDIGITYKGDWHMNNRHGNGKMKFSNGDVLQGSWSNGYLNDGYVIILYGNGDKYQGEIVNGMRHGEGTIKYQQGYFYRGPWKEDHRSGIGLITYKTEFFFEGLFINDSTEGKGVLVKKDIFGFNKNKNTDAPDSPSNIFRSSSNYSYNRKSELGHIDEFKLFKLLSLDMWDTIFVTLTSEQLDSRINFPHPTIESGIFRAGKLFGAGMLKFGIYGKYEGNFKDGARSGWGKMVYNDPDKVCSWFHDNEGTYYGEWKDNFKHGFGVFEWPDRTKYEGRFSRNMRNFVTGKMYFNNGEIYEGGWVNDKMEGKGTYWKGGIIFKGQFIKGLPADVGSLEFADGRKYDGNIDNWLPNGNGAMRWPNGDLYEGSFKDGNPDGNGKMVFSNGDLYVGEWDRGQRTGNGIMNYSTTGEIYDGEWVCNYRVGLGILKSLKGDIIFWGKWKQDQPGNKGKMKRTRSGKIMLEYI
ncbi:unnamed protein product [Blepharisma stoltei]|uniref:Phosphatidylinositol-4-phosphate 5-kinase n=1 Tax=Blepharisma stoltei TaxID=1481888 RepID=A0AAU9KC81_9CILI|nr:unnamed protein product [Blepharisma stoltei]